MKLSEIADVLPGTLVTRIKQDASGEQCFVYNQNAFYSDFYLETNKTSTDFQIVHTKAIEKLQMLSKGDIIFNLSTKEAVIVSAAHEEFILPYNYCKIKIKDKDIINSQYLVDWLNDSKAAKRQIEASEQGKGAVKKITIKLLKSIDIQFPNIERQRLIAELNFERKSLEALRKEREKLLQELLSDQLFEVR